MSDERKVLGDHLFVQTETKPPATTHSAVAIFAALATAMAQQGLEADVDVVIPREGYDYLKREMAESGLEMPKDHEGPVLISIVGNSSRIRVFHTQLAIERYAQYGVPKPEAQS